MTKEIYDFSTGDWIESDIEPVEQDSLLRIEDDMEILAYETARCIDAFNEDEHIIILYPCGDNNVRRGLVMHIIYTETHIPIG